MVRANLATLGVLAANQSGDKVITKLDSPSSLIVGAVYSQAVSKIDSPKNLFLP
jgi:hypothetical protein